MWSKMSSDLHVKCPLLVSDFNKTLIFSAVFPKNTRIQNFMKIRPVGAELFHEDGCADMAKLIATIRNFVNAPNEMALVGRIELFSEVA